MDGWIDEVDYRAGEGQTTGMYGAEYLAVIGAMDRFGWSRIELGSGNKLTEVKNVAECN